MYYTFYMYVYYVCNITAITLFCCCVHVDCCCFCSSCSISLPSISFILIIRKFPCLPSFLQVVYYSYMYAVRLMKGKRKFHFLFPHHLPKHTPWSVPVESKLCICLQCGRLHRQHDGMVLSIQYLPPLSRWITWKKYVIIAIYILLYIIYTSWIISKMYTCIITDSLLVSPYCCL